jgi:hypothetical protein
LITIPRPCDTNLGGVCWTPRERRRGSMPTSKQTHDELIKQGWVMIAGGTYWLPPRKSRR